MNKDIRIFKYLEPDKQSHLPKHYQLKQKLLALIQSKRLVQGERLPSDNELMDALNLSRSTVRQAIGELVKEGILFREQGRGTFIADASRRGAGNRYLLFIVYDFHWLLHPFISESIQGAKAIADKFRYDLAVSTFVGEKMNKSRFYEQLENGSIGGLLVLCEFMTDDELLRLEKSQIPFVWLGGRVSNPRIHAVSVNFQEGFFSATSHLLRLGHRNIGVLTGWSHIRGDMDKLSGYEAAMKAYGLSCSPNLLAECHYDELLAYRKVIEWLRRKDRPTAIIAFDDIMAAGAIRAANDEGLSVPEDLSVIGCNDMKLSSLVRPALTTINVSAHMIGEQACRMLIRLKEGESLKRKTLLPACKLILRDSCAEIKGNIP